MQITLHAPFSNYSWKPESWKELGFASPEDVAYWEVSSCGIQCLKMAIDGLLTEEALTLVEYIRKGTEVGAYTHAHGWVHAGLAQLAEHMGVRAYVVESLAMSQIQALVQDGRFVIISVKSNFSVKKSLKERLLFWRKYGGHMVLVVGCTNEGQEGFFVHDTSVRPAHLGVSRFVPMRLFSQSFTGRGVVVYK